MTDADFIAVIEDNRWRQHTSNLETLITKTAHLAYVKADKPVLFSQKTPEINIIMTDNQTVQDLNRDYRNKDKPTNVLSFPQIDVYDPDDVASYEHLPKEMPLPLGDIFIAYETIISEAENQNKTFESHLSHLIIHGVLHLLGYDHIEEDDAIIMEKLERQLMDALGYEDPYKDLEEIKAANE